MHSTPIKFDYNKKVWGISPLTNKYINFQGLDLKFFDSVLNNKISSKLKVLDLGCGAGNVLNYLKNTYPNLELTGLDISSKALEIAKKNNKKTKFINTKADKIPKNLKFDLIYALDTLEHFENINAVIKSVYSSLFSNGYFYAAVPLEKQFPTLYYFLNLFGWQGKKIMSGHVNVFNTNEFVDLIEKSGFKLISKRYSYHFLMSIFDIVFYFFQTLIGKSIAFESTVSQSNNILLKIVKNTISVIGYIESSIFYKLPGGKGHFLFQKVDSKDFFSLNHPLTVAEEFQIKWGLKKFVQPRDIEIKRLLRYLNYKNAKTVLDFGSANGVWLERLISNTTKKGFGVDISPVLIIIANKRKRAKGKYYLCDNTWPIKKNSIDFCFTFDTFEHIKDKEIEVKNLSQSIKRGGKILIYTLNPNNKYTIDWLFEKLGSDFMYKRADHDKKLFISPQMMAKMLEKVGFSDVGYVLYDGPANLLGRVFSYLLAKIGLTNLNDKLIRFFNPVNNLIDAILLKKGYSNGYFLWAKKD